MDRKDEVTVSITKTEKFTFADYGLVNKVSLSRIAHHLGLFGFLTMPEEIGVKSVRDLSDPLKAAIDRLEDHKEIEKIQRLLPAIDWDYIDRFRTFAEDLLECAYENPEGEVRAFYR